MPLRSLLRRPYGPPAARRARAPLGPRETPSRRADRVANRSSAFSTSLDRRRRSKNCRMSRGSISGIERARAADEAVDRAPAPPTMGRERAAVGHPADDGAEPCAGSQRMVVAAGAPARKIFARRRGGCDTWRGPAAADSPRAALPLRAGAGGEPSAALGQRGKSWKSRTGARASGPKRRPPSAGRPAAVLCAAAAAFIS